MTKKVRLTIAGVTLAAMLALVCAAGAMSAGEGGPVKEITGPFGKLADAVKKGDADAIKKEAAKFNSVKEIADTSDLMHLFKNHKSGGLGWGSKRAANPATDGLEKRIQEYAKNVKAADAADPMNEEAAQWLIAMAESIKVRGWPKAMAGGKTPKAWADYADASVAAANGFSKAVATKNPAMIKTAAGKLNDTCAACHSKFK
jgi:cytochrome c556